MTLDILAFGAHPDDVELASAGTLIKAAKRGLATGVISLTRGEMGTRGTLESRAAEFDEASTLMGARWHEMLPLPDGHLCSNDAARTAVVREMREHQPRIVLLPWPEDRHPDHGAASQIVQDAAFLSGLSKLDTGQQPHRPAELVYYMSSWEFEPSFVVDISEHIEDKRRVLQAYRTQVFTPGASVDGPPTFIASEHFMELVFSRMAHYGHLIGKKYGEAFRLRRMIEIRDLVESFGERTY